MVFSGLSPDGRLIEIAKLRDHPFMVGSQFHPEFKSRPIDPIRCFLLSSGRLCSTVSSGGAPANRCPVLGCRSRARCAIL
jgi:CTP synthase